MPVAGAIYGNAGGGLTSRLALVRNPFLLGIAGALLLMAFSAINGYALVFIDTRSYIHGAGLATKYLTGHDYVAQWKAIPPPTPEASMEFAGTERKSIENNGVSSNRSIYYGALLLLGYLGSSFWATIFFQAYIVATLAAIVYVRLVRGDGSILYLILMLAMGLLTTLGPYIAYMMPDIFTGAMIVSTSLLFTGWQRLSIAERVFCAAVTSAALLFHQSNNVILLGMTLTVVMWGLVRRHRRINIALFAAIAGCFFVGFLGQQLFNYGLERATGSKPLLLPHLTAHLVDMGPGYRYIVSSCPQSGFTLCRFKDRLPIYWEDFVGLADPRRGIFAPADLATKHALSSEQVSFALHVFQYDPVGVLGGLVRDAGRQLVEFSPLGLRYIPKEIEYINMYFPPASSAKVRASRAGGGNTILDINSVTNLTLVASGLIIILVLMLLRRHGKLPTFSLSDWLAASLLQGVVWNALVCGMLASPLDRYQGRVIWIIPFVAAMMIIQRKYSLRGQLEPYA